MTPFYALLLTAATITILLITLTAIGITRGHITLKRKPEPRKQAQ